MHLEAIESLGSAGMSSDDSGKESDQKVLRIKKRFWRAPELGPFLRVIDRIADANSDALKGDVILRLPRLPGGPESTAGGIVKGLPVNFYDPTWLANIKMNARPVYDALRVKEEEYDLRHGDQIME